MRKATNPFAKENNPFSKETTNPFANEDGQTSEKKKSSKVASESLFEKYKNNYSEPTYVSDKISTKTSKIITATSSVSNTVNTAKSGLVRSSYVQKYKEDKDNDELYDPYNDEEYLTFKMKQIQREDVELTGNMVKKLVETEEIAVNSLSTLDQQSEQLRNAERGLLETDVNLSQSKIETRNLKKYSGIFSFTMPKIFSKKKRQDDKELTKAKEDLKKAETELRAQSYRAAHKNVIKKPEVINETLEHLDSDDEEKIIDKNLDLISKHLGNLKAMGLQMQDTIDSHNKQLERLDVSANKVDMKMGNTMKSIRRYA